MSPTPVEQRLQRIWETPKTVYGWLSTVDHKDIGRRYLATAFIFLIVGGIEALIMRIQLASSDQSWLTPEAYNQIFTMHGITMIFWYASPILSGFAIYLIPLMIGARDMAFPRFNAFTYWTYLFSGILIYIAPFLGQAPHAGWFAYVPYTGILLARLWNGLLCPGVDLSDYFDDRRRDQFHRHYSAAAGAWNEHQQDAAVYVQHRHNLLHHFCCRCPP